VFVEGERVKDVSRHKAFPRGGALGGAGSTLAAAPENRELMNYVAQNGEPVHRSYQMRPRTPICASAGCSRKNGRGDLRLMGRTPDHVAGFFTGYAYVPEVFAKAGKVRRQCRGVLREDARRASLRELRDRGRADRPQQAGHKQSDPALYAGVVKERDDGIVISGAQQLATGGVLSDWLAPELHHPLQPGDENYATARGCR